MFTPDYKLKRYAAIGFIFQNNINHLSPGKKIIRRVLTYATDSITKTNMIPIKHAQRKLSRDCLKRKLILRNFQKNSAIFADFSGNGL